MKRSAIKPGTKGFKAERKPLERRTPLAAVSARKLADAEEKGERPVLTLARSRPRRRPPTEQEIAAAWHEQVCVGRRCVVCGQPAGPWGHHGLRKEWLFRIGLKAYIWDVDLGVPPCDPCHMNHESGVVRIERAHLIATGHWETLTRWARLLDARHFPDGHEPVLSRLERDYPSSPWRESR